MYKRAETGTIFLLCTIMAMDKDSEIYVIVYKCVAHKFACTHVLCTNVPSTNVPWCKWGCVLMNCVHIEFLNKCVNFPHVYADLKYNLSSTSYKRFHCLLRSALQITNFIETVYECMKYVRKLREQSRLPLNDSRQNVVSSNGEVVYIEDLFSSTFKNNFCPGT